MADISEYAAETDFAVAAAALNDEAAVREKPRKSGKEFAINATAKGDQTQQAITALADGGYVVTWMSHDQDGDGYGIFAQRYDSAGQRVAKEFQVNVTATADQYEPAIAALADGSFVIAWTSDGQDGDGAGIFARRFGEKEGDEEPGKEFQVNAFAKADQHAPSIASLADGGFVMTWVSRNHAGEGTAIYAQRYDAAGEPASKEFAIHPEAVADQQAPAIAGLIKGGFVTVWAGRSEGDGSGHGIYAQLYDNSGEIIHKPFQLASNVLIEGQAPAVAALAEGGFVAAWTAFDDDEKSFGVYAQRFDEAGEPVGKRFLINTATAGAQEAPSIAALSDGGFVVSWMSEKQDGDGHGIYAQRYDKAGEPHGEEFQANAQAAGDQQQPAVAGLTDGSFIVSWMSLTDKEHGWEIIARHFGLSEETPPADHSLEVTTHEDAKRFALDLLDKAGESESSGGHKVINLKLVSGDAAGIAEDGNLLQIDPAAYDRLAEGQNEVIDYIYEIIDENGDSVSRTARIIIEGRNDAPWLANAIGDQAAQKALRWISSFAPTALPTLMARS